MTFREQLPAVGMSIEVDIDTGWLNIGTLRCIGKLNERHIIVALSPQSNGRQAHEWLGIDSEKYVGMAVHLDYRWRENVPATTVC